MSKVATALAGTIAVFGVLALIALVLALPVWLLWNAVIPQVSGWQEITLAQALWLNLLCSLLFKSTITTSK